MKISKPLIIYDNRCLFCIRTKNFIDKLDKNKKLKWIGIDNFNYKKFKLKKEDLLEEMHLISGNNVYKGYFAFKQISKKIPLFYIFYLLSLIPGVDFIGDKVYNLIAKHRYKL